MIAQELEVSLHMAFVEARQKRHEFITVEHLLMALLDIPAGRRCWFGLNNTAITRIDFDLDRLRLVYMNRADFLPRSLIT